HPAYPELGLGQQAVHQVGLVVAGGSDDDLVVLQARVLQQLKFAGVGVHPDGVAHRIPVDMVELAFEQHDRMPRPQQLARDGAADGPGSGNGHLHDQSLFAGGFAASATASPAEPEVAATYTVSSAWTTVLASGRTPCPKRMMNATRAPVALSSSRTVRPYQSSCRISWATATVPVGSRQVVVPASPSRLCRKRS